MTEKEIKIMKKTYEVKNSFGVGELNNVTLKSGTSVDYDLEKGILTINGLDHEVRNLKSAIKAGWLVPVDGELPELDGPIGETEEEAMDRRRKKRFEEQKKQEKSNVVNADEREVARLKGAIGQEKDPEGFMKALNAEPVASNKNKFTAEVVEDDSQVVVKTAYKGDAEVDKMKQALNQKDDTAKKVDSGVKEFKVFTDHYDAETVEVGKYTDANMENTIKNWSQLHWTKKADVIKEAGKDLLSRLKNVENSEKIIARIDTRLGEL
jgi:hypothetical protein